MVRKIRYQKDWTQAMLTARCARLGWDLNDNTIAKIEAGIRCVTDREVTKLARALGVALPDLFPPESMRK